MANDKPLSIKYVSLKEIKPYENNPRDNRDAIEQVKRSIKQFGFLNPIVVNGDGVILAGHTRYAAAKRLKLAEVPVIYVNDIDEVKGNAFRLVDNKTHEYSYWDWEMLNDELQEMTASDFQTLEMEEFGFMKENVNTMKEVNAMLAKPEKTEFSVSFVFPVEHKENIENIIRFKGKKSMNEAIMNYIENEMLTPAEVKTVKDSDATVGVTRSDND